MIAITVKGLAKFMTQRFATRRKTLRDFKFPKPEGAVQAAYYAEARRAIRDYHSGGNNPSVLVKTVNHLRIKAYQAQGQAVTRLDHNIRALESYLRHFSHRRFSVLSPPRLKYIYSNVAVSALPDLHVQEKGHQKVIKLELGTVTPDPQMINIILQVMYEAARSAGLSIRPQDVIYLDASRATQHKGAKIRTRLKRDIEAACESIEALWPSIK